MDNSITNNNPVVRKGASAATSTYRKRQGTSGIGGQLYETKLLTLALFRALHNDRIKDFYLGTNLDEAGAFDDVVLRYSLTDRKEKVIFVQAKHKDVKSNGGSTSVNFKDMIDTSVLTGNFNLGKYFESYLQIKYMFDANSENAIFRGSYEEMDVEFLVYTNATISFPCDDIYKKVKVSKDDLLYTSKPNAKDPGTTISVKNLDEIIQPFRKISAKWHCEAVAAVIAMRLISENKIAENSKSPNDAALENFIAMYINNFEGTVNGKSSGSLCSTILRQTYRQILGNSTNKNNRRMLKTSITRILSAKQFQKLLLTENEHDELIRDFFKKTKFYVEQATERIVEEIVKSEIQGTYPDLGYLDLVFLKFHDDVQLWWLHNKTVEFLTKKCNYFKKVQEYIAERPTEEKLHLLCVDKIRKLDVSYDSAAIESSQCIRKLNEVIDIASDRVMHIFSRTLNLTCSKLLQFVESRHKLKANYKFLNTKLVEKKHAFASVTKSKQRLLIIASKENISDEDISNLLKSAKKLILVSESKCNGSVRDKQRGLIDLTKQCQEKILDTMIVFQGIPLSLRAFLGKAPRELVNEEILSRIIDGVDINISKPLSDRNDTSKYYIERRFLLCAIKKEILNSQSFNISTNINNISKLTTQQDIVLLCGASDDVILQNQSSKCVTKKSADSSKYSIELSLPHSTTIHDGFNAKTRISQNVCTNEDYVSFQSMCTFYQNHNVHMLRQERTKQLGWLQSRGNLAGIREYLDENGIEFRPNSISDFRNRVVILAGEPGMGKSTILTGLAMKTKEHDPTCWIVRLNLLDMTNILAEWAKSATVLDDKEVFNCLVKFNKHNFCEIWKENELMRYNSDEYLENFESKLFYWYFEHGKIIFLIDGFDEISPYYTDITLKFLHYLKEKRNGTLWVTTRSGSMQINLENALSTFSYVLKPFTNQDAKNFLLKFWKAIPSIKYFNETKFHVFANHLLVRLSQSIDTRHEQFVSIPLHIKMIAIIFQESFQIFHDSNDDQLSTASLAILDDHLDLVSLYNKFIDFKLHKILEQEKNRTDISKPENIRRSMKMRTKTINNHFLMSMFALFDESELKPLLKTRQLRSIPELLTEVDSGKEKGGIIYRVMENKPIFIHQSFAEFFAATFIWKNFESFSEQDDKFESFVEHFLVGNLIRNNKSQICKFIQLIAKKQIPKQSASTGKATILLENIISPDTHLENDAAKSLLKVVEYSLNAAADSVQIDQFLLGVSHSKASKLLILFAEIGCTTLVDIVRSHFDLSDTLNTLMYLALREGHVDIMEMLVVSGANITAVDKNTGLFPLHIAAERGWVELVHLLLERKASVCVSTSEGFTPLYVASAKGHEEVVRMLLENGASVNVSTVDGLTPLYVASQHGHFNVVYLLLENGANIHDGKRNGKYNPLYVAAQFGHTEICNLLLQQGANIDCTDSDTGFTPLHIASKHCHIDVVELLLENGATVNIPTSNESIAPLHVASENGHTAIVELLLAKGASVNAVTSEGIAPLYLATHNGHPSVVRSLLERGANVDGQFNGFTPLYVASYFGFIDIVRTLIEKKANVNSAVECGGYTPLLIAAYNGHTRIVQLLLDSGANIDAISTEGETALKLTSARGHHDTVAVLQDRGEVIYESPVVSNEREMERHQRQRQSIYRVLNSLFGNVNEGFSIQSEYDEPCNAQQSTIVSVENDTEVSAPQAADRYKAIFHVVAFCGICLIGLTILIVCLLLWQFKNIIWLSNK